MNAFGRALVIATAAMAAAGLSSAAQEPVHIRIDDYAGDAIAGIWQFRPSGAIVELKAAGGNTGAYDMILLDSPDFDADVPATVATLRPTGPDGLFDAELTHRGKAVTEAPGAMASRSFIISVADGYMTLRPYRRSPRLSPERWIRYFLRTSLKGMEGRPDGTIGAVRLSRAPSPYGGRNITSLRPVEAENDSESLRSLAAMAPDSATRSRIELLGYDKPRQASAETMFVRSSLDSDIAGIQLTLTYRSSAGEMLHRRTVTVLQDIPAGQTRMCRWPSWDVQKSFYYINSSAPRFGGATPYSVSARIDSIYTTR